VSAGAQRIAAVFRWACLAELEAPKPGNVHVFADGHRMTMDEFVRSADAAAGPLSTGQAGVGARILGAVEATFAAVGSNTNLGIVLLCAPLAAAAEVGRADLRASLARILENLTIEDADLAFRAITRAAPAGLGRRATLLEAMAEAAERDRVARQYATVFADVFELGVPLLEAALDRQIDHKWSILAVYLGFLSAFADSHVVRKHGPRTAGEVRQIAATFAASMDKTKQPAQLLPELLAWDASLKADGINPGTSADLTVATLFAHRLRTILPSARNSG
jgi:triphosphoribosyl-dephospho-CoA synthase